MKYLSRLGLGLVGSDSTQLIKKVTGPLIGINFGHLIHLLDGLHVLNSFTIGIVEALCLSYLLRL